MRRGRTLDFDESLLEFPQHVVPFLQPVLHDAHGLPLRFHARLLVLQALPQLGRLLDRLGGEGGK